MGNQYEHDWECVEVGNWYSEYKCTKCKEFYVIEPEDEESSPPKKGCSKHD